MQKDSGVLIGVGSYDAEVEVWEDTGRTGSEVIDWQALVVTTSKTWLKSDSKQGGQRT